MGEYAASYKEGFTCTGSNTASPTPINVINTVLPKITVPIDGVEKKRPFLDGAIIQQQQSIKALSTLAGQLAPLAQKMADIQLASNAGFESTAPTHSIGTLQGFILLFFVVSFVVLAVVSTFMVNAISGGNAAAGTFAAFIVVALAVFAVLQRFA